MTAKRLLTTKEAANHCGVSIATFERHLVNNPKGPRFQAVRIGGRKMFDLQAIDAWIDTQSGIADRSTQPKESGFDWEASFNGGDQGARR
jgi:predicted DNA-binding transcriptional regulator AlpA